MLTCGAGLSGGTLRLKVESSLTASTFPSGRSCLVISALNGRYPPRWSATSTPFRVTVARVMAAAKSRKVRMPPGLGGASKCFR